jgi:hypothetical protein
VAAVGPLRTLTTALVATGLDEALEGRGPFTVFAPTDEAFARLSGTVVVPIRAKLPVGRPTLFAVTSEVPGGVAVSERKTIMVTAKVP